MTLGKEHMAVTKTDIEEGVAYDERSCAVALCVRREAGIDIGNIRVSEDCVTVDLPDGRVSYACSPSLSEWINHHDEWKYTHNSDSQSDGRPHPITLTVYETHELDGPQGRWYDPRLHVGGD